MRAATPALYDAHQRLLVCGIPATSKSTFGRWLRDHNGFSFVELEAGPTSPDGPDQHGLRRQWESFWRSEDLLSFPRALLQAGAPVVVEWGFPTNLLHVVVALQRAGLTPWWFEGDRLIARQYYASRDDSPLQLFDYQVATISAAWSSIEPVFTNRIVRVVNADGTIENPAAVFDAIVKAARANSR